MAGNSKNVAEMEEAAALMREAGLTVLASAGWKDRGRSSDLYPWALIDHHTAATNDITQMLIDGRSDLPGPLCNFELREYGDWCLIASGRANHAGEASVSNSESYGIEATGPQNYPNVYGPAAFPQNYDSYVTGVAAILAAMGAEVSDTMGHKEIAPTRKIDPYFDMGAFRKGVTEGGVEDDMPSYSQWPVAERQKLVGDVVKATSRGEMPDGTKPGHLVSASGETIRKHIDLTRIGDRQGADADGNLEDSHDFASVEGTRRKLNKLAEDVAAQGELLDKIAAAVGVTPEAARGR